MGGVVEYGGVLCHSQRPNLAAINNGMLDEVLDNYRDSSS
jgi:hypothetical protein